MAISFKCSGCGASYSVKDEFGGKKTKCKKCGALLTIPQASAGDDFDLGSLAPPPIEAPAAAPPREFFTPTSYQAPKSKRESRRADDSVVDGGGRGLATLKIPDHIASKVSLGLLGVMVLIIGWIMYGVGGQVASALPGPLQWRMWIMLFLLLVAGIAQHLIVVTGVAMLSILAAMMMLRRHFPEGGRLHVAGAMTCPTIALLIAIFNMSGGHVSPSEAIVTVLVAILVGTLASLVLLQALLHLDWPTSFLSSAFLIPALVAALYYYGRNVQPHLLTKIVAISGMDRDSVQKWAAAHPEEIAAFQQEKAREYQAKEQAAQDQALRVARQDPFYDGYEAARTKAFAVQKQVHDSFRDEAIPMADALVKEINALKPAGPSRKWDEVHSTAENVRKVAGSRPTKDLPPELLLPPKSTEPAPVLTETIAQELGEPMRVDQWTLRIPKGLQLELERFDTPTRLVWSHPFFRKPAIFVSLIPIKNPQQIQPMIATDPTQLRLSGLHNLYAVRTNAGRRTVYMLDGRPVYVALDADVGGTTVYITRGDKYWLNVRVDTTEGLGFKGSLEAVRSAIYSLKFAPNDNTGLDPFGLDEMLARFADDAAAGKVIKTYGEQAVPRLQAILDSPNSSGILKMRAGEVIREVTGKDPTNTAVAGGNPGKPTFPGEPAKPAAPKVIDPMAEVAKLKDWFGQREALKNLANAQVDPAVRDDVAKALEQMMLSSDGYRVGEEVAAALIVWQRPQTTTILGPLIADEKLHPWMQKPIIKVFASTKDKKNVYPIVRWIPKQGDTVVEALISMGPVAEDETIKLLSEKNGQVRRDAARVLSEIGTKKSLGPLLRAGADQRDASAAAMAKAAHEAVKERVDAAAATQPATPGAPGASGATGTPATATPAPAGK